mgnify:CR=1 FL=1
MLPPEADQVTEDVLPPVTVAVNCWVAPWFTVGAAGLTDTFTGTVTVADAVLVVSALLLTVTVKVPPLDGAVYLPEVLTLPLPVPATAQVTAVFVVPVTVAANCWVPPWATVAVVGLMLIPTAETVTVADAVLVVSALLFTTTVKVPAFAGAV